MELLFWQAWVSPFFNPFGLSHDSHSFHLALVCSPLFMLHFRGSRYLSTLKTILLLYPFIPPSWSPFSCILVVFDCLYLLLCSGFPLSLACAPVCWRSLCFVEVCYSQGLSAQDHAACTYCLWVCPCRLPWTVSVCGVWPSLVRNVRPVLKTSPGQRLECCVAARHLFAKWVMGPLVRCDGLWAILIRSVWPGHTEFHDKLLLGVAPGCWFFLLMCGGTLLKDSMPCSSVSSWTPVRVFSWPLVLVQPHQCGWCTNPCVPLSLCSHFCCPFVGQASAPYPLLPIFHTPHSK